MKKYFYLVSIYFISLNFISCENNINELPSDNNNICEYRQANTRDVLSSWDLCTYCTLPSGDNKKLPWAEGATTTIPYEIRKDIKVEDGWTILDSTVKLIDYTHKITSADSGANYILLYNINTGMLKGFYYAETMSSNNCGFWQLQIPSSTKLFNFAPDFAEPIDGNSPQKVLLATITTNGETEGFELGWNCFILELSYDANSHNQKLDISGFAMNQATLTLEGAYNSKSSGTLVVSTQNKSSLIEGVASGFGSASKQWIVDNTGNSKDKAIKYGGVISSVISDKGITGLISTGLYKVFGSLLGSSKTSSNFNYSTNGKVKIQGNLLNPSSGIISPITELSLGNENLKLGIWNIESQPTYYTYGSAELTGSNNDVYGNSVFYYWIKQEIRGINVIKNPGYTGTLNYTSTPVIYTKYKGEYKKFNPIAPNSRPSVDKYFYEVHPNGIIYSDSLTEITSCSSFFGKCNLWPNYATNTNPIRPAARLEGSGYECYFNKNIFIKILITLKDNNDTHYSSKTFLPKRSFLNDGFHPKTWSSDELTKLGFKH